MMTDIFISQIDASSSITDKSSRAARVSGIQSPRRCSAISNHRSGPSSMSAKFFLANQASLATPEPEAARRLSTAASSSGAEVKFSLQNVSFAAGNRTLLQPLSLTLEKHRVYGLIGHNGSGKSTLVKLLARQQQPTSGTIDLAA